MPTAFGNTPFGAGFMELNVFYDDREVYFNMDKFERPDNKDPFILMVRNDDDLSTEYGNRIVSSGWLWFGINDEPKFVTLSAAAISHFVHDFALYIIILRCEMRRMSGPLLSSLPLNIACVAHRHACVRGQTNRALE